MSLERIRKGDMVVVTAGRDKGKSGKVLRVLRDRNRAVVESVNMVKKHQRAQGNQAGGILEREAPIHLSNVMPLCPECEKGVRIGRRHLGDGEVVRVCGRCGNQIEASA